MNDNTTDTINDNTINTIVSRIYTINENIIGMLQKLEVIMDNNNYKELYHRYLIIAQNIPADEILTELEKKYENLGADLKYMNIERDLEAFESELEYYNDYKEFSDLINEVKITTDKIFDKNTPTKEYIKKNKQLINSIINIKNKNTIQQFTKLLDTSIETIFISLKTLSIAGNEDLLEFIKKTNNDYFNEHLAAKIRKSINITEYKGKLEDDYIDAATLYECAIHDEKIISRQTKAKEYEKRQAIIAQEKQEYLSMLQQELKKQEMDIQSYQDLLKALKANNMSLKTKKLLLRLLTVPALALPLACPFIGHSMGKRASSKILLTKTITRTVDAASLDIVSEFEDYKELNTSYVASITICEPWKKNLSGASYSRNCTVYDYTLDDTNVTDDFHLTTNNIDPNNLVEKYTYEEVSVSILDDQYFSNNQIYVTETYQDYNDVKYSEKYNIPYTVTGFGTGLLLGTTELLAYYFLGKRPLDKIQDNLNHTLAENEKNLASTNKKLKLTLTKQKQRKEEYKSLADK